MEVEKVTMKEGTNVAQVEYVATMAVQHAIHVSKSEKYNNNLK